MNPVPDRLARTVAVFAARIASGLGAKNMRLMARFNKRVTNPIVRRWAPRARYMAVIGHHGRRSGRPYRTPVMAFVVEGILTVVLNYGSNSDWVRNVQEAGGARVEHRGRHYRLVDPRVIPATSPAVPAAARAVGPTRDVLHGTLRPVAE